MFTDLSLQVALGSVPSSQTSLYRSPLWVRKSGHLHTLQITPYKEDRKKRLTQHIIPYHKLNYGLGLLKKAYLVTYFESKYHSFFSNRQES